ncbi:DegV family protein [Paeniclostridium sp. NSJ-45]|uniref:DegV family protein n=1 Tax=Paeniclostridium hominis TaxID=2764329 RepID=A0ABR7K012_9FIRM|nr:DegV family protein [Paeniclostridium hominis]MBC6002445.1 DegV family protein [Paeniclostridium hominis]
MKIKLMCDSLCDIPMELAEKHNIEIIPLTIIIEDKEYKDGVDMTEEEFYETMKKIKTVPKTSQATYMQFKEAFDKYKDEYSIVCISGSSKSSGTYQSAVMAKNDTDGDIHIFDTLNLSLGSGRVSVTTAAIGNMLSLKPVFSVKDGNISLLTKVRGKKNVIHKLIDLLKEQYESFEDKNVMIGCGANKNEFEILKKEVQEAIKAKNIYLTRGGACICSHTGPDIIAISCSN